MGGLFSRLALIFSLSLVLTPALCWAGPNTGEMEELRIGTGAETNSLDPGEQTTALASNLCDLIFDTYFSKTPQGEFRSGLATSLSLSLDGLEATLSLRKGVLFSNGEPLTSAAVKTAWDRLLDPDQPIPQRWVLNPVKECRVKDEHTVLLRLERPFPALKSLLCLSLCSPISPRALGKWGKAFRDHPVGAGPYMLAKWIKGKRVVLERNENHYGARPTVKRLVWEIVPIVNQRRDMVKSGKLDVCRNPYLADLKTLAAAPGLKVNSILSTRSNYLAFNCAQGPLRNKTVRQALNLAVNKKRIIKTVLHGAGAPMTAPVSPVTAGSRPQERTFAHNPVRAREMLEQAGFDFSRPIKMLGCKPRFAHHEKILELIQKDFQALGVKSKFRFLDWPSYLAGLNKPAQRIQTDAFVFNQGSLIPELGWALRQRFHSRTGINGNNRGNLYANPVLDGLLDQSLDEPDPARRAKLLLQAETMVWEDCPWLWLYTDDFPVFQDNRIKNLIITPLEKIYPQGAVRN